MEDADEELKQIEKEEKEAQEKADLYSGAFVNSGENGGGKDGNANGNPKNSENQDNPGGD